MYPPKVDDNEVEGVIRDLTLNGRVPSGAAVRVELARRFGSRGGVTRIYRLLANERARLGSTSLSLVGARLLELENQNLRDQLRHARQREDVQQAHWQGVVTQLLGRFRAMARLVSQAAEDGVVTEALRQEVAGAETRAGQLEVLIRAFGPAAYRPKPGG